jgi:hypothetical protein
VATGQLAWDLVTGAQGSVLISIGVDTNIASMTETSYYSDDLTPAVVQCTGDPWEYGTSGPWIPSPHPNTDPLLGAKEYLTELRTHYHEGPGQEDVRSPVRFDRERSGDHATSLELFKDTFSRAAMSLGIAA